MTCSELYKKAKNHYNSGQIEEAKKAFREVVADFPGTHEAQYAQALLDKLKQSTSQSSDQLTESFEKLALKIDKLQPYLGIVAMASFIGVIIAIIFLPKQWIFLIGMIMLWSFGTTLFYVLYNPQIEKTVEGKEIMVSIARRSNSFSRVYGSVFMIFWFGGLSLITVMLIVKTLLHLISLMG